MKTIKYVSIALAVLLAAWFIRAVKLEVQKNPPPSVPLTIGEAGIDSTGLPVATPTATPTKIEKPQLKADKYSFIWFTGSYCDFNKFGDGCHDSFITLINVEKKAEAVRKDGKKITLYHYTGQDIDDKREVLNGTEWLTEEQFKAKYIPFTKARTDTSFVCWSDDIKNYKLLMTINDEDQGDTYVVENKDGFVEYITECTVVDQVKTFN